MWLISRRVREERELCCDDLAIAACNNDRVTYVSALAELESLRQVAAPALAANGGSLLARIKRILTPDDVQTVRGRGHWMAGRGDLPIAVIAVAAQSVQGRQSSQDVVGGAQRGADHGAPGGMTAAPKAVPTLRASDDPTLKIEQRVDVPCRRVRTRTGQSEKASGATAANVIGPFRVGDDITIEIGARSDADWSATYATVDANGNVTVSTIGTVKVAVGRRT